MLRIFLTSSPLSTLFMTVYAKKTHQNSTDILLIDSVKKKESLLKSIHDTASFHQWDHVYNFSETIDDDTNLNPTILKKLTREFKTKPIVQNIYNILYKIYLGRTTKTQTDKLNNTIKERSENFSSVELNLLTETMLNSALHDIFPNAKVNYFEHGVSDYFFATKKELHPGNFYCIFHEQLKLFLQKRGQPNDYVFPFFDGEEFEKISEHILGKQEETSIVKNIGEQNDRLALILLIDAERGYNVPKHFWKEFMDKCLAQIADPQSFTFIIKPHPFQSEEVIQIVKTYFTQKGLKFHLLDHSIFINMSVEVIVSLWKDKLSHVFSSFSSALFYLSMLYPFQNIQYYYSYEFMLPYLNNADKQYRDLYLHHRELIEEVFSVKCKQLQ